MKGVTMKGTTLKSRIPGMASVQTVPQGKSLRGQGATASSKKSSSTAGFSATRKKGYVKGC